MCFDEDLYESDIPRLKDTRKASELNTDACVDLAE